MSFFDQVLTVPLYANTDIVKKCKKYPEFREELQQIDAQYSHDLNMAIYSGLEDVESMGVFQVINKPTLTISIFAYLMPPYESYAQKFYLLFIKMLDQQLRLNLGRKYTVIYYHTLCDNNYPYNFLVTIFKKLPIYYYAMLDKLFTVNATFFLRKSAGLFDFGRLYKLFERKLENIQKLGQFAQIVQINQMNVLEHLPDRLMKELQYKTQKKIMKEQKKGTIVSPAKVEAPPPLPKPKVVMDCLTIDLKAHKLDEEGIPVPLNILIKTLRNNPQFLDLQGIFRKSGSIQEEQEIVDELKVLGPGDQLKKLEDYSGFAIAGVVKKFFTKLLTPIVPYILYNKLLQILTDTAIKSQEEVSFVLDFLSELPSLNRKIILYLMSFLKKEVISRQDKNKMNNYNMSVCFCPCLFRSESPSLSDLFNSGKYAGILNLYFSRFEEVKMMQERSSSGSEGQKLQKPMTSHKPFRISMA